MKKLALLICVMSITGGFAHADDMNKANSSDHKKMASKMAVMTPEQRGKMADAHDKMASCLRSDRPMKDCHEEMMKSCQENMGKEGCPMGGMGMHHGN